MRVVAGELKGRRLVAPRGWKVRPTSRPGPGGDLLGARRAVAGARSSTSTAAPARWRSRRSRAAPRGPSSSTGHRAPALRQRRAPRPRRAGRAGPRRRRRAGSPQRDQDGDRGRFDLVFVDAPYRLADRLGPELDTICPRLLAEGGRVVVESGARRPLRLDLAAAAAPAPLRRRRRRVLRTGRRMSGERDGTVVCPGSYDPVTNGHLDIIGRAARSSTGSSSASSTTRCARRRRCSPPRSARRSSRRRRPTLDNVEVRIFSNLLVEFAREHGATAIVKGLRAISDFEYEFEMAQLNRKLAPGSRAST